MVLTSHGCLFKYKSKLKLNKVKIQFFSFLRHISAQQPLMTMATVLDSIDLQHLQL